MKIINLILDTFKKKYFFKLSWLSLLSYYCNITDYSLYYNMDKHCIHFFVHWVPGYVELLSWERPKDGLTEYRTKWSRQVDENPNLAMVEHSICQPGLPLPHGDSQYGSWGFDCFQRAKSLESRLFVLPGEPCSLLSVKVTYSLRNTKQAVPVITMCIGLQKYTNGSLKGGPNSDWQQRNKQR